VANESKHPENPDSEETKTEESSAGKSKFAWLYGKTMQYWLAILLISTIVFHGIGLAYYKVNSARVSAEITPEIALGDFQFAADKTAGSRINGVNFSLYITANDGLDQIARSQLTTHKYRVQQEVEALLRQAHSGDFEDPSLSDLKRRLREQINNVLKLRVVSDVIVTNLKITASENKAVPTSAESASKTPWLDKSSTYVSQEGGK
jgi:flagellar basal body-associated protein FliL